MIKEIGSIILIKYILTLNILLNINAALPSQPSLRIGTLDSFEQYELAGLKKNSRVIFIECDVFSEDETHIKAECILIPHSDTFDCFFSTIFTAK